MTNLSSKSYPHVTVKRLKELLVQDLEVGLEDADVLVPNPIVNSELLILRNKKRIGVLTFEVKGEGHAEILLDEDLQRRMRNVEN